MHITDIVDDFIELRYNEEDVLAIGRRRGKIIITADAKDKQLLENRDIKQ